MPTFTGQKGSGASVASKQDTASQPEVKTSLDPALSAHDEELDFLLRLEAPIAEKAAINPDGIREPDLEPPGEEHGKGPMHTQQHLQ